MVICPEAQALSCRKCVRLAVIRFNGVFFEKRLSSVSGPRAPFHHLVHVPGADFRQAWIVQNCKGSPMQKELSSVTVSHLTCHHLSAKSKIFEAILVEPITCGKVSNVRRRCYDSIDVSAKENSQRSNAFVSTQRSTYKQGQQDTNAKIDAQKTGNCHARRHEVRRLRNSPKLITAKKRYTAWQYSCPDDACSSNVHNSTQCNLLSTAQPNTNVLHLFKWPFY